MTRSTPEMASAFPNFRTTSAGGRLALTYDRSTYTVDLQWDRVSSLELPGPEAETLPVVHRGYMKPGDKYENNGGLVVEQRRRIRNRRTPVLKSDSTKDQWCMWACCGLNLSRVQCPLIGVSWNFIKGLPAQVPSLPSNHSSK
ncbi:hypothetical protein AVEN_103564-1 [Araneus ventricosus]|uniref:Uncharacterized protein n=1 Tax=Araneus ventricosus TaxID=182803 RepID=A0A4Y2G6Y4_ARAVE|nr:hypothetical protein AVEN_103564-1 [Araneus ventricosus]